jgi:Astacin (Peptidase family M12A)
MKKNTIPNSKPKKLCKQPTTVPRTFDESVNTHRRAFILTSGTKWANGTEITYMFIEKGTEDDRKVVRKAFSIWKELKIGLSFREVKTVDEALVRIGFNHKDDSWSYVGRDILSYPKSKKTMNFGIDLSRDSEGMSTALHEIGHTIGFEHEHQSPFAGIEWNRPAVYKEFSGTPNKWNPNEIDENILNKIPANQLTGSEWDSKSIMEYEFGPGLILKPAECVNGVYPPGVLSKQDINGVRSFYPPVSKSKYIKLEINKSEPINIESGAQIDFLFKAPNTRKYTFQTIGKLDTVMVIWELVKTKKEYLSGDDDSGTDKNSEIVLPLVKGREYLINIRVLYNAEAVGGSIIVSGS